MLLPINGNLGPISHRFQDIISYSLKLSTKKISAKLLQMETWLLLTAYEKLRAPYPMVLSPIIIIIFLVFYLLLLLLLEHLYSALS